MTLPNISATRSRTVYTARAMKAEAERDAAIKRAERAEAEVERLLAQNQRLRAAQSDALVDRDCVRLDGHCDCVPPFAGCRYAR